MATPTKRRKCGQCAKGDMYPHDNHEFCIGCQIDNEVFCDPRNTCECCRNWTLETWTAHTDKFNKKFTNMQTRIPSLQLVRRAERMLVMRDNMLSHLKKPIPKPGTTKTEAWIAEFHEKEAEKANAGKEPQVPQQLSEQQYRKLIRKMQRITDNQKILDDKLQHLIDNLAPEDKKEKTMVELNSDIDIDITEEEA